MLRLSFYFGTKLGSSLKKLHHIVAVRRQLCSASLSLSLARAFVRLRALFCALMAADNDVNDNKL